MSPEMRVLLPLITTKNGDGGQTDTLRGKESKDSPGVEMVGILDEFQAVLGVVATRLGREKNKEVLESEMTIQKLMTNVSFGNELSEPIDLKNFKKEIKSEEINDLVKLCDEAIETDEKYKKYFLDVKNLLIEKDVYEAGLNVPKIDDCFKSFFKSTEIALELMDKNDIFREEIKKIEDDFVDILNLINGEKQYLDLNERVEEVEYLEEELEKNNLERNNLRIRGFKFFVDNSIGAYLNLSRTIARKIERRMVTLKKQKGKVVVTDDVLRYINRVSDVLYLMSDTDY